GFNQMWDSKMRPDPISLAENLTSCRADAAIAEYLEAIERGTPPKLDEFLARHEDVAADLREFLEDYQAFERVSPRMAADTAGSPYTTGGKQNDLHAPLTLPRMFGNFELIEEIARGGMGVVCKARQISPSRIVALKMILTGQLASKADMERFYAEAQAA